MEVERKTIIHALMFLIKYRFIINFVCKDYYIIYYIYLFINPMIIYLNYLYLKYQKYNNIREEGIPTY